MRGARVVGIVSRHDLVRVIARTDADVEAGVRSALTEEGHRLTRLDVRGQRAGLPPLRPPGGHAAHAGQPAVGGAVRARADVTEGLRRVARLVASFHERAATSVRSPQRPRWMLCGGSGRTTSGGWLPSLAPCWTARRRLLPSAWPAGIWKAAGPCSTIGSRRDGARRPRRPAGRGHLPAG